MSKISPSLKALINASFAHPGPTAAPAAQIREAFVDIARDASRRQLGPRSWIVLSAAATFTLNSPDSLTILHDVASSPGHHNPDPSDPVQTAELIREVGLKCISFNGIPRSINCLNAFHASLPASVTARLATAPSRALSSPESLPQVRQRGRDLWKSIYRPLDEKLYRKLARSHPDLPVHILDANYGPLLADPPRTEKQGLASVGRLLTSVVAIASLRAQTGVGPQVLSHVYGLRKAVEDGSFREDVVAEGDEAAEWLAGDEGNEWILRSVDRIVDVLGGGNFAAGRVAKL
ncbi:unnamed protein product [Clonostachys chloroleuca]|uniref:Dol-P-Man:Man(5)GlcNAc(2)-PP-Dol alpha-1,3-mannosyltransferase n=1 Tax=Clonostachys chloroleuca TaxID=1926264 RepID=A0AA35LXJ3_9HYPO|nr:unnamed protein product [Clonostachys chloroleuca]